MPCASTGQDGEIRAGATLAYVDNGDGTITDVNTGLMWEKKSLDGSSHDVNFRPTWDGAFTVHVAGLNAANFAGHNDWRVPNVKELVSIVNYENVNPAVSPAFNNNCASGCTVLTCSCTRSSFYWSSTTGAPNPGGAWGIDFQFGDLIADNKTVNGNDAIRAVRAGS